MQKSLHWSVCRDGFREKAVPASHKTALECSGIILMPGVVTWNDRNPLSEVRDKRCRPPRLEIRKGPFCQGFRRPVFFSWLPCKFREQKTFLLFLDSKHVSKPASYLQIYVFRNSQMEAHLKICVYNCNPPIIPITPITPLNLITPIFLSFPPLKHKKSRSPWMGSGADREEEKNSLSFITPPRETASGRRRC